jgi:hypothetical protein
MTNDNNQTLCTTQTDGSAIPMSRDLWQQFVWLSSYSLQQEFDFVTNTV